MHKNSVIVRSIVMLVVVSLLCLSCTSASIKEDDVTSNNYSAVENSLKKGAKPDAKSLYLAVARGDQKMLKLLIDNGAEINSSYENHTILGWAACYRKFDIVNLLIDKGASVNFINQNGFHPFVSAAHGGDLKMLKLMKEKGADVKSQANLALMFSLWSREEVKKTEEEILSVVRFLLNEGAIVNIQTPSGSTPLLASVANDYIKVTQLLIDKNADVNTVNSDNVTPLMYAAEYSNYRNVNALLKKGADVNIKNSAGETALISAVLYSEDIEKKDQDVLAIIKALISKGADVNIKQNKYGNTPLHLAVLNIYSKSAQYLIANKSDINAVNSNGKSPLMIAAEYGNLDLVKTLLANGANADIKDMYGRNSVFLAVTSYSDITKKESDIVEIIKLLALKGADLNIKIKGVSVSSEIDINGTSMKIDYVKYQGYTPLILAVDNNFVKAAGFLISKGADINAKEDLGLTPLMITARNGDKFSDMAGMLLAKKADPDAQNNGGWTALMICCQYKSLNIANQILNKKPDLHLITSKGNNTLEIARMYKLDDLAEKIEKKQRNL